jgi:hypothetical protein
MSLRLGWKYVKTLDVESIKERKSRLNSVLPGVKLEISRLRYHEELETVLVWVFIN